MLEVIASVKLPDLRDDEGRYLGQGFRHDGDDPVPLNFNRYLDAKDDWAVNIEWDDGRPFCINHLMSPDYGVPDIDRFGRPGTYADFLFKAVFRPDGSSTLLDQSKGITERIEAYKAEVKELHEIDIPEFTEGLCGDGAAIFRDGQPMSISEILAALRKGAEMEVLHG